MARNNKLNNEQLILHIEEMIKKYNKKPEKKIKKKDIVKMFQKATVILPVTIDLSDAAENNEIIEGMISKPDIVKDGKRTRLIPVFTSYEQIPRDYMDNFSLLRVSSSFVYSYMEMVDDINGIVINPFTELNLELRKKMSDRKQQTNNTRQYEMETPAIDRPEAMVIYNNKKYPINKIPFTIGREGTNIEIPESYISKIHAVISYKDGKYRVADYDSTNGTRVNGTELKSKLYYEIRDGYEIELSDKEKMLIYIK